MSLEKLLYRFLLDSPGALLNRGESIGIGVLGKGDMGGDVDIGDSDDWHDEEDDGKNEEEELVDQGERGVEEQVDTESSLALLLHWMVSLTGGFLSLLLLLSPSMLSNDWQHSVVSPRSVWGRRELTRSYQSQVSPGQLPRLGASKYCWCNCSFKSIIVAFLPRVTCNIWHLTCNAVKILQTTIKIVNIPCVIMYNDEKKQTESPMLK